MAEVRRPMMAVSSGTAIGVLGGLIGLGGGEFRLPVLTTMFGFTARTAVPMNLLVSLITLGASLVVRAGTLSLAAVRPHAVELIALGMGGMIGARWSARLLTRLSDYRLESAVAALLAAVGVLLVAEAFLPTGSSSLVVRQAAWLAWSGFVLGVLIGAGAALLGVAGGELLIPTLLFLYGADIRIAGTGSLMISLVTVTSGLARYARLGAWPDAESIRNVAAPMGVGSIMGALIGGVLVGIVSASALKIVLGAVLIAAAGNTMARNRRAARRAG